MIFIHTPLKHNINSALIIGFIDDFLKNAPKGIKVIVLDNAPTHHSAEFQDQLERWEEEDLFIFFLPQYSPHLNIIEILWRKIKYEWLEQHKFVGVRLFLWRFIPYFKKYWHSICHQFQRPCFIQINNVTYSYIEKIISVWLYNIWF